MAALVLTTHVVDAATPDVRGVRWGDTVDQVEKAETAKPALGHFYEVVLGNEKATLSYAFDTAGGLERVAYIFDFTIPSGLGFEAVNVLGGFTRCDGLRKLVESKYGPPTSRWHMCSICDKTPELAAPYDDARDRFEKSSGSFADPAVLEPLTLYMGYVDEYMRGQGPSLARGLTSLPWADWSLQWLLPRTNVLNTVRYVSTTEEVRFNRTIPAKVGAGCTILYTPSEQVRQEIKSRREAEAQKDL